MNTLMHRRAQVGDLVVVGDPDELKNNPSCTNWFLGEVIQTSTRVLTGKNAALKVWNVDSGAISWERANRVTRALGRRPSTGEQ